MSIELLYTALPVTLTIASVVLYDDADLANKAIRIIAFTALEFITYVRLPIYPTPR